ncbi:MAG: ABC transporter permease, partial [Verrucomicrobia bacterium]|nr:ABC transporter permease [Verrucomicrobiota bacterium]
MTDANPKPGSRWSASRLLTIAGPFLGLLFVTALFGLSEDLRPVFYTGASWKNILTQTVIVAVGALGMTLIIVSGGIDLSVGSVVALCSVVGARLLEHKAPASGTILA